MIEVKDPDPAGAAKDRQERLSALKEAVNAVYDRGIAFQDEPWWESLCDLYRSLRETS